MVIEDVRLLKYENEGAINPETTIKSAYEDFINNEKHIVAKDYSIMIIGDTIFELSLDRTREYFIKTVFEEKTVSSERQKYKRK